MALAVDTRLGVYEITGRVGAGGMGEVYRANDTRLNREVAIKTLPGALADDADRLARFDHDAKLLAVLNHAHIASVYGLDEHEGTPFLAMELVEAQTLEEDLGPLPVEDASPLALQIAQALEAAHEKGVVHRDLKPGRHDAHGRCRRDGRRVLVCRAGATVLGSLAAADSGGARSHDIARDGRFLMILTEDAASGAQAPASIVVVQNFTEELGQRVPPSTQ